jgi:hypothetical protein
MIPIAIGCKLMMIKIQDIHISYIVIARVCGPLCETSGAEAPLDVLC